MFESFEVSRFLGRPVRLFVFQRQSVIWRFCNADRNLVIGGNTYLAAPIDRGEIKQTVERAKDKLTITLAYLRDPNAPAFPATQALGDNWHPYIPSDPIAVTCLATHYGDTDPPAVEWSGIVVQPAFTDAELTLTCEQGPAIAQARNQGPKWQKACWKTVYSTGARGCNLDADPIAIGATLTAVAGSTITAPAFASPPRALVGGTVEWETPDLVQHTANIVAQTADTLTLDDVTGLVVGSVVIVHTIALWVSGTVTAVSGLVVTAPEFADAPLDLTSGWVEWTRDDGVVERRSIMSQAGGNLTLLYGGAGLAVGRTLVARPGCQQTWAACDARGNTINYGGSVYKPRKDPTEAPMTW